MEFLDIVTTQSYPNLLLVLFAVFISYVLSTAIYRLYFHPLAKYPGPFWARLSTWPSYLATVKQDRHVWLYKLQQEYGNTHFPSDIYSRLAKASQVLSSDIALMLYSSTHQKASRQSLGRKAT